MKIVVLDVGNTHYMYVHTIYKLFGKENVEMYLSEFLSNGLYREFKFKSNVVHKIKNHYVPIFESLKLIKKINKSKIDLLFINTLQNNWFFYFIVLLFCKKKILLTIHNIKCFYEKPKSIKGFIKYLIRKYALTKTNVINVYGEHLKKYIKEKGEGIKITFIPFSAYDDDEKEIQKENKKLIISIPGSFDIKRRDYCSVYNVFKKIEKTNVEIELYLLGKLASNNSLDLFNKFKQLKNVKLYEHYVKMEDFKKIMNDTDIILGPLEKYMEFDRGIKEEYGLSKASGFVFDQILYAKPGLSPSYIRIFSELRSSTLDYVNEEELYDIIINLYENRHILENLKKEAKNNSKKFTYTKIMESFLKDISEI
jgi:hypothetical protein